MAVAVWALAVVPSAFAHATLLDTTPSNDAVIAAAPRRVLLRFDEPIETVLGSVRVYDGNAKRVDDGHVTRPQADEVAVGLPSGLGKGTYTVAWRVISADSHPVRGAFVFHVGKPGADAAGVASQVLDANGGSGSVDRAFAVVRFVNLVLILLCVGGTVVLARVVRDQPDRVRRPMWWAVAFVAALLAVASMAWVGIEGAQAAGLGLDAAIRTSVLRDVLGTRFGEVWLTRSVLSTILAVVAVIAARRGAVDRRAPGLAAIALALAIAATPGLSGHARVDGGMAVVSDWLHVVAAGVWVGGLVFLLFALVQAGGERWSLAATAVPRFSSLAVIAVGVLIAAGVVNGFLEVRSWAGLWETTYGRLLLAKVALLLPLLALGAFNNRRSVRRLRAGASPPERRWFVRSTVVEVVLMVAVVGVTAVLVAERPAKAQTAAAAGPVSRDTRIGPFDLNFVVDPARTGMNEMHLYLLDRSTGQPVRVDETRVSASLPAAGIGPLRFTATPAGPGHAVVTAASFPLAGLWRILVEIRRGEFDQWSTTLNIPIRKDTPKS